MVIEKPIGHWAGADAAVSRYVGAALLLASQKHLEVIEVLPHVWKAALGPGMGRATPKQYRSACERVWSLPPGSFESEDEAAAAGILWWAKNRVGGSCP
jgi:Holliday junction resolvasome RuvABC endonuclease subunit